MLYSIIGYKYRENINKIQKLYFIRQGQRMKNKIIQQLSTI